MIGQTELVHRAYLCVDDTEDEIDTEPLAHDARTETTDLICVSEVGVAALVQLGLLQGGQEFLGERECIVRSQTRSIGPDGLQRSMQTPERRRVYTEMNVRGATA